MKKHFLILMLMALLPLAGWAADLDVTKFTAANIPYGSDALGAVENTQGLVENTHYTVETTKFYTTNTGGEEIAIADLPTTSVDKYYIKVTGKGSYGGQTIYVDFRIYKTTNEVTTAPAIVNAEGVAYTGNPIALIKSAEPTPAAKWGSVEFVLSDPDATAAPATGWSTIIPTGTNAGTYKIWYRASADATNYDASAPVALIQKINGSNPTVGTEPAAIAGLKYTGEAQALITAGANVVGGELQYKLGDDGTWETGVPTATAANTTGYSVYWRVLGDAGHNDLAPQEIVVTIAKEDPVLSTAPQKATGLTYNKTNQALLTSDGIVTLGATLKYKINDGDAVAFADVKAMDAGTYTITPTVAATDNTNAKDYAPFEVTIGKKTVYVYVQDKTKVYDATAFTDGTDAGIEINGVEAGDAAPTGIVTAITSPSANVGDYVVAADLTGATVGGNYKLTAVATGTWSITPRPIELTAKDQTITFGDPAPVFAVNTTYISVQTKGTDTGCALADNEEDADVHAAYTTHVGKILTAIQSVGLAEAKTSVGTYENNIVITKKASTAEDIDGIAKNYTITVNPGTYKIETNGSYTLIAQNKTVTYGASYELTYLHPDGDVREGKTVTFDVYDGETLLNENPKDAGTYTIKIHPDKYATADFGGDDAVITYVDGTLTINPKTLTIACADQTLRVGKKATDLVASKVTFDGVVAGDEGKIDYTLAFNTGTTAGLIATENVDADGALLAAAATAVDGGVYAKGIKAELSAPAITNRNKNYTLDVATSVGKLTVVNAATLVLGANSATDAAEIATYNDAEVIVNIDFTNRNGRTLGGTRDWVKENWVTLTLPFDISVADLSKKLGYALVNVIDPSRTKVDGTGSEFYGKLVMKGGNGYKEGVENEENTKLAANKPILVKIADDIANLNGGVINFGAQKIVAPTSAEDCTVDAGEGAKFVGTYAEKTVTNADDAAIWFMIGGGYTKWAYITDNSTNTWTIKPFEAFIDMSGLPASARNMTFFFEELDGSVTAIKSISVDNLNNKQNAEGWYNLNGVKLNGVPTQKGVYIQNGKKVVIK